MKTLTIAAALLCATALPTAAQDMMTAEVINTEGEAIGTVTFEQTPSGFVLVVADLTGIPPGAHGFHVHETGVCNTEDGFDSAGGHYAGDKRHGFVEGGPHPGDFPNAHVQDDGVLMVEYANDRLSLRDGPNSLADADGSAVIIHSGPDDYESQPAGDAGSRIACGVIE